MMSPKETPSKSRSDGWSRRMFLTGAAALLLGGKAFCEPPAHADFGGVNPPLHVPDLPLICGDGSSVPLRALLTQHVTAIQLMFTACTTTCPIQGTIFHHVQELLPTHTDRGIQLLSLSIDPQTDGPANLRAWLGHYKPRPGWIAAAPRPDAVEAMRRFFGAGATLADNHTTQVSLIDRKAMMVYRSVDLPDPRDLADALATLA